MDDRLKDTLETIVRSMRDVDGLDSARLRLGTVTALQASTCTVRVGGSTVDIVGVVSVGPVVVGQVVWLLQQGPLLLALGSPDRATVARDTHVAAQRSQTGGFVDRTSQYRWEGSRLYWTGRLISISHGNGPHWSPTAGWYGFLIPAVGTIIPGFGSHAGFTVDAGLGIPLNNHEALYGVPNLLTGGQDTTLALVGYTAAFVVPSHWVLLAVRSESDGRVMLGNGELRDEWRGVVFENAWTQYGGYSPAAYRKDSNRVTLRGLVQNATASSTTVVFTLPSGYRPANTDLYTAWASSGNVRIDISASGTVQVAQYGTGAGSGYVSLAGISFIAER